MLRARQHHCRVRGQHPGWPSGARQQWHHVIPGSGILQFDSDCWRRRLSAEKWTVAAAVITRAGNCTGIDARTVDSYCVLTTIQGPIRRRILGTCNKKLAGVAACRHHLKTTTFRGCPFAVRENARDTSRCQRRQMRIFHPSVGALPSAPVCSSAKRKIKCRPVNLSPPSPYLQSGQLHGHAYFDNGQPDAYN